VTHLRKRMLEELQRRNYSEGTTRAYLQAVQQFAVHFGKSPDKLGPDDLRSYQAYVLFERKLAVASVVARVATLRFFFIRTLKRRDFREELPTRAESGGGRPARAIQSGVERAGECELVCEDPLDQPAIA
jgi:integrase/recombinase XerD